MEWLKKQTWMAAAAGLGAVFLLAVLLVKPIGVSTQFSVLSGIVHSAVDLTVITEDAGRASGYQSSNAYYDKSEGKMAAKIKNPINYDFIFVLAIPLGAFAAHIVRKRKNGAQPVERPESEQQCPAARGNVWKQYLPAFLGGFILLFGARMAGAAAPADI